MVPDAGPLFLDTTYALALVNARDQWHASAALWHGKLASVRHRLLTTEYVLFEIADGLASVRFRGRALGMIESLRKDRAVEIVPASSQLFESALALFKGRADKAWGLTDCASFTVMTERGITGALTCDEDFRQAGFRALLLENT